MKTIMKTIIKTRYDKTMNMLKEIFFIIIIPIITGKIIFIINENKEIVKLPIWIFNASLIMLFVVVKQFCNTIT